MQTLLELHSTVPLSLPLMVLNNANYGAASGKNTPGIVGVQNPLDEKPPLPILPNVGEVFPERWKPKATATSRGTEVDLKLGKNNDTILTPASAQPIIDTVIPTE